MHRSHLCANEVGLVGSATIDIAPNGQASTQVLQPMHLSFSSWMLLSLRTNACVGHTLAQGASSQWRQVTADRSSGVLKALMRGKNASALAGYWLSLCEMTQAISQALQPYNLER